MRHGVFGWSYPPGAENDPNAPYNQREPIDCSECNGTGTKFDPDAECPEDREYRCDTCDGTGEVDPRSLELEERDYEPDYDDDDLDPIDGA